MPSAVTFDFGQTLVDLDHDLLVRRVAERGVALDAERARSDTGAAWAAHARAKRSGMPHEQAWCVFMRAVLVSTGEHAASLAQWLWREQALVNLWRKPVPGMFDLVQSLHEAGAALAIITNSEGRAEALAEELGLLRFLRVVADSGVLGIEKPDPRIFRWTADRLGVALHEIIHVGDSWEADVQGAVAAGARAVWLSSELDRPLPDRVAKGSSASELARILARWA